MAQHTKRQFVVVVGERAVELFAGLGARRRALVRARDLGGVAMSVGEFVTRRVVAETAYERARKAGYAASEDAAWDGTLADLRLREAAEVAGLDAEAAEAGRAEAARLAPEIDLTGVQGRR